MRSVHRSLIALAVLSPAGFFAACGSSSNGGGSGGDGGAQDSSFPSSSSGASSSGASSSGGSSSGASSSSGSSGSSGGDAGIFGDNCPAFDGGAFTEGPHGPFPTVVYYGGPILPAPQIITFTFPTTRGVSTLQAFGQTVTQSPWFAAVSHDYCINDGGSCIGPGAEGISVPITTAAATTYVDLMDQGDAGSLAPGEIDLDAFMNDQIAAAVAAHTIPAPSANSLYAFYFPTSSTVYMGGDQAQGGTPSCTGYGGYHSAITYKDGVTPIVYAIMPDCILGTPDDPAFDLENVTIAASHEVIEATTDPNSNGVPAWYLDQPYDPDASVTVPQMRNDPWATAMSYGEIGDNCESIPDSVWWLDSGTQVQRIWSISAAAGGHNPCVPVPAGEAYYNTSTDKAIYVADVGTTFTVDLTGFSDVPRSSWRLDALDYTPTQQSTQYLKLEFVGGADAGDGVAHLTCVNNKTAGQLRVTLLADPGNDQTLQQEWPEADGVIFSADVDKWSGTPLPDGGAAQQFPYQFWSFAVVTPTVASQLGITDAGVADVRKLGQLRAAHHVNTQPPRGAARVPHLFRAPGVAR